MTADQLNQNFIDLDSRLKAVEGLVHPASGFRASLLSAQTIPTSLRTKVTFDKVEFDTAGEYNKTTGGFSPAKDGVYVFTCNIEFVLSTSANWYVTIQKNGADLVGVDLTTAAAGGASPGAAVVTRLAAGDTVTCAAYQGTGMSQPLYVQSDGSRDVFSGARIY